MKPFCIPLSQSTSELTCTLPNNLSGGVYQLLVTDEEIGQASGDFKIKIAAQVDSVSPVSGSRFGATEITISGTSLDVTSEVTLGSVVCDTVLSKSSAVSIVCVTRETDSAELTENTDVAIYMDSVDSGVTFGYYNTVTPLVTDSAFSGNINRLSVSGGESVTLTGNNFSEIDEENFIYYNGEIETSVRPTKSGNELNFVTASVAHGTYDIQVFVSGLGLSDKIRVKYHLKVTDISASEMSYYGGKSVTITGRGFGEDKTKVNVLMNEKSGDIESLTDTEIVFITPSMADVHVVKSNGDFSSQSAFKWDESVQNNGNLEIYSGDAVRFEWDYTHEPSSRNKMAVLCESESEGLTICKNNGLFNLPNNQRLKSGELYFKFTQEFVGETIYFYSQHHDHWGFRLTGSIKVLPRPASQTVDFDVQVSEKSADFSLGRKKRSVGGTSFTLDDSLTISVDSVFHSVKKRPKMKKKVGKIGKKWE